MEEKKVNWDKWGVIIAVISIVIGFFGWNAASCLGCISCSGDGGDSDKMTSSVVSVPNDVDSTPSESEVTSEIEQKTGKRYIENVKVLSSGSEGHYNGFNFDYSFSNSATANTGDEFSHSMTINNEYYSAYSEDFDGDEIAYVEFYLGGEYKDFTFTSALSDSTRDTACILVDNEVVWSRDYKSGSLPENATINVDDALSLKIVLTLVGGGGGYSEIIFGDAYFTFAD